MKGAQRVTEKMIEEIRRDKKLNSSLTTRDLGNKYMLHRNTIGAILREKEYDDKKERKKESEKIRKEQKKKEKEALQKLVVATYYKILDEKEFVKYDDVATKLGISKSSVFRIIKEHGIKTVPSVKSKKVESIRKKMIEKKRQSIAFSNEERQIPNEERFKKFLQSKGWRVN
jgi:predicted DNA-binding transcriptional regulator AlpA